MAQLQYTQHGQQITDDSGTVQAQIHWGVMVHCAEPTTGVYSGNDLAWECFDGDYIDYQYECAILELERAGHDEEYIDNEMEHFDGGDMQLYGSWKQGETREHWEPNTESTTEDDFAGDYNANHNTMQVLWSKTIKYGRMCSPCYPGQVDADPDDPSEPDSEHIQAYYALPDGCVVTQAQRDEWSNEWEHRNDR